MVVLFGLYGGVLRWQNQQLATTANGISADLARLQEELGRLNQDIAQRKVSTETEAALRRAEAALQGRERVRDALESGALGSPEGFAEFLRAFARQAQDGLWMVGLQMAEGGRNIMLEGRTLNPEQIPAYIRGLNSEPTLRGRSFEALNVHLVGDDKPAVKPAPPDSAQTAAAGAQETAARQMPFHEFQLAATAVKSGFETAPGSLPAGEARR